MVTVDGVAIDSGGLDMNKTKSARKAVLGFFKAFFPKGYTWIQVVNFVKEKKNKDPVCLVREILNKVNI